MCVGHQGDPGPPGEPGPPGQPGIGQPAQQHERAWWGDCANTFHEEQKQLVYARYMGLDAEWGGAHPPTIRLGRTSVLDIGGGPSSLLLKTVGGRDLAVVDPCPYPRWVYERYQAHNIVSYVTPAEEFVRSHRWDEVWIYNTLQHVLDPERVIAVARRQAARLRIFDWLGAEQDEFHPHRLEKHWLDTWIGTSGRGRVVTVNESGAVGTAYVGHYTLQ